MNKQNQFFGPPVPPRLGEVLIRRTANYGTPAFYPANEAAQLFAEIAGTVTLTHATLARAERLGFSIKVMEDTRSWRDA